MSGNSVPALDDLAIRIRPQVLRSDQQGLSMLPALGELLPSGLAPGSLVSVSAAAGGAGATSLLLAMAAGPSQAGAWVAVVGGAALGAGWGLVAASEMGVVLERLAVVTLPSSPAGGWGQVVAALLDGFQVVVLGPRVVLRHGETRRLAPRLRERGGVLVRSGAEDQSTHLRLVVHEVVWEGLRDSRRTELLGRRRMVVEAGGRCAASRRRRVEICLPMGESDAFG